jgi:hypothetical protein
MRWLGLSLIIYGAVAITVMRFMFPEADGDAVVSQGSGGMRVDRRHGSRDLCARVAMTERRRFVGRPKEFDGTISVRLTKDLHDALSREALQRDRQLSQIIRERLEREYFVSQKSTKRQTSAY